MQIITAGGKKIFFDYCIVATGGRYLNHPWLNPRFPHRTDKFTDEAAWAAVDGVESDLQREEQEQYNAVIELTGFEFDYFTFQSFMKSHGHLIRLFLLLRGIAQKSSRSTLVELFGETVLAHGEPLRKMLGDDPFDKLRKFSTLDSLVADADFREELSSKTAKRAKKFGTKVAYRGLLREDSLASGVVSRQGRRLTWEAEAASVAAAQRIVVIGAGVVGVETVADILTRFPDKEVTLVHSRYELMENVKSSRARKNAFEWLVKRGAKVHFDDTITAWRAAGTRYALQLQSGASLEAEKIIVCTGYTFNTDFMKTHFGGSLATNGEINVDKHLRIANSDRVFALGDVSALEMIKSCTSAVMQAEFLGRSLGNFIAKGSALESFDTPSIENLIVELGPNKGMLLFNNVCLAVNKSIPQIKAKAEKKVMKGLKQTDGMARNWLKFQPEPLAIAAQ